MSKFSIIVPVYNTAPFLEACIESALKQQYADFELILVDDGSDDGSGAICDRYSSMDDRVQVIHKENSGAGAARNAGIRQATGEYLLFLDSDDYYGDDLVLERLSCYTQDVVCFNYRRILANGELKPLCFSFNAPLPTEVDAAYPILIQKGIYTSSSCLKCVKKVLFQAADLFFVEGRRCEDLDWNLRLIYATNSVTFANDVVYVYRVREGSSTQTISQQTVEDIVFSMGRMLSFLQTDRSRAFKEACLSYIAFQYCTLLINIRFSEKKHLKNNIEWCRRHRYLLKYDLYPHVKWIRFVAACCGVRFCSLMLYQYYKAKAG